MLAVCHHASQQSDQSQRDIAVLQAQLLKDKYDAIKLLGSLGDMARLRRATARVGRRIEDDEVGLFDGLDAEPFAHPWTDEETAQRDSCSKPGGSTEFAGSLMASRPID
jgi:hypothetical protein